MFWIPAMWGIFGLVPANFVVVVMQTSNLAWNVILDYIAHRGITLKDVVLPETDVQRQPAGVETGGGVRGVNIIVDRFSEELRHTFNSLNDKLVEKDRTISQLRHDLDTLQFKYEKLEREHDFMI